MRLYGRSYLIRFYDKFANVILEKSQIFGTPSQDNLRLTFHVNQKIGLINSVSEFHLYNLNEASRTLILSAISVTLAAGYGNDVKVIYKGQIINVFDNREQPDFVFSVFCLDYINFNSPINIISKTTDTALDLIEEIASFPVLTVESNNLKGLPQGALGKSYSFTNLTYLQAYEKLAGILNINIWVTNGYVYTGAKTYIPAPTPPILINYLNGMIGSPVFDIANAGVNVKVLLNPQIIPGNEVKIETINPYVQLGAVNYVKFNQNALTQGVWQVLSVDHVGDSREQDWYTYVQGYSYQTDLQGLLPQV